MAVYMAVNGTKEVKSRKVTVFKSGLMGHSMKENGVAIRQMAMAVSS